MDIKLSYKSDVCFKYSFGRNTESSTFVRQFMLKNLLPIEVGDCQVDNPELIPQTIEDKNSILDIFMARSQVIIDIEMQVSSLSSYIYKRFQYYGAKMIAHQLEPGEKFNDVKDVYQIVFIDDVEKENPALVKRHCTKEQTDHKELPHYVHTTIYVFLPYIEQIAKEKDVLNEFEAMLYLLHKGTLENIKYEEKEGAIKMLKKLHANFIRNKKLVNASMRRFEMKENYELKYQMGVEDARKEALSIGKKEGVEEGIRLGAKEKTYKLALNIIKTKFKVDASHWLRDLTEEQLDEVFDLIMNNYDYEEIEGRFVVDHNLNELVFS